MCSFVMHARTHSAAGVQSGLTGKGERRCAHSGCMNAHTLKMEPAVSSEALMRLYQSTQRHVRADGIFSFIRKTERCSCPDRHDVSVSFCVIVFGSVRLDQYLASCALDCVRDCCP